MLGRFRRGDSTPGTGATLILVIILVLVLYVVFLPPAQRDELLNEGTITNPGTNTNPNARPGTTMGTTGDDFVFEGPGQVDYVSRDQYQHDIPTQTIYTSDDAEMIFEENTFTIEKGWFVNKSKLVRATLTDYQERSFDNILLTFEAPTNEGILTIYFNGEEIYSNDVDGAGAVVIKLKAASLLQDNVFAFETTGVGLAFWKKNKYVISNLNIKADITDLSRSAGDATFSLRPVEAINLERATLRFVPQCERGRVGTLTAHINGQRIFTQIPDCGIANTFPIDRKILREGENTISFVTSEGNYIVDNIRVETTLDDERDYVYYFTLDTSLFSISAKEEPLCGQIDGQCPANCGEDQDKDCCFDEYDTPFWCTVPTTLQSDRCVGSVTQFNVLRCASGYEDQSGNPPEDFEERCGDDNDGVCPVGCSIYYDKDCCLDQTGTWYFCSDLPITGVQDICVREVSQDTCKVCPGGFDGNNGDPKNCFENANPLFEEANLKNEYKAIAKFIFTNDRQDKIATIRINGFATRIDTRDDSVQIDISRYVKDNSNYIQIVPESNFNLVEVSVDVDSSSSKTPTRRTPTTYTG